MRTSINWLAVLIAAFVIYAIGFLIYGLAFDELWMSLSGYTRDSFTGLEWRMALSPVMPILTAIGLAVLNAWTSAATLGASLRNALAAFGFFALASRLYGFVYGDEPTGLLGLDALHLLLGYLAAGVILGLMRPKAAQAGAA